LGSGRAARRAGWASVRLTGCKPQSDRRRRR
jgi:hypothetical protein